MIDIDNTIVAHNSVRIFKEDHLWILKIKELGIPITLITYNFEGKAVDYIAKDLDCPVIKVSFPYIHHNTVRQAAKIMGILPEEVVGINDFRIALTVLRLFGCRKTILVSPISLESEKESKMLCFLRLIENKIIVPLLKRFS